MNQTPPSHHVPTVNEAIMAIREADAAKAKAMNHKKKGPSMSVREKLRTNRRFGYGAAVGLLILGMTMLVFQWVNQFGGPTYNQLQVFYSADNGKTYFADSEKKLPPFDHPSGVAVRAHVFPGTSGPFVGYLERFSPEARTIIERVSELAKTAKPGDKPPPELAQVVDAQRNGRQVKRPKDANWVPINSAQGQAITKVKVGNNPEPAREIQPSQQ